VDHSQQNHDEEHKDDGFCFGSFSTNEHAQGMESIFSGKETRMLL
jgi:hypothetical protein